jgi:hypothetical protein
MHTVGMERGLTEARHGADQGWGSGWRIGAGSKGVAGFVVVMSSVSDGAVPVGSVAPAVGAALIGPTGLIA